MYITFYIYWYIRIADSDGAAPLPPALESNFMANNPKYPAAPLPQIR